MRRKGINNCVLYWYKIIICVKCVVILQSENREQIFNFQQELMDNSKQQKKELARLYYFQGMPQKQIAEKVGVSAVTLGRWVEKEGWKETRSGMSITRPELVNKNLLLISRLLDKLNSETIDLSDVGKIVDQITKLAAAVERIDKKANVVDSIEVFSALNKWLETRMEWDKNITPEFMQLLTHYQELFINEKMKK